LSTLDAGMPTASGFGVGDGGMTLSADGTQLLLVSDDSEIKVVDVATGREVRKIKLPDNQIESLQLFFSSDGRLLAAGIHNKHLKLCRVFRIHD